MNFILNNFVHIKHKYEVCKLSNETGNVASDLATLRRRDFEGRNGVLSGFATDLDTGQRMQYAICLQRQCFFKSPESIEDEPRSGRPSRTDENVDNCMLHHDNVPCHTAISVTEFLASKNIPMAPQPDFLFPRLKNHLEGRYFGTIESIQMVVKDQLKAISVYELQHCYEEWNNHLQRCVDSQVLSS
ncbi:hypothetical protein NQ318_010174 [Aromia moschata]|uniref:Transposase n=1 Tax=Aromia moschata TaxID=1265417 RepID=A0AAV8XGU2_9CUCU|nr:hypothetical protein NQ318_010174 [Aromia moschata]